MHTLHWISVEADTPAEAEVSVVSQLEAQMEGSTWWDWFDTEIGGRWKESAQTVCASDSAKYEETIERVKANRKSEVEDYMERIDMDTVLSLIENYEGESMDWDTQMNFYRLKSVAKLLNDDFFNGSYYYDVEAYTTDLKYLRERVAKDSSRQYLVPIDFHF